MKTLVGIVSDILNENKNDNILKILNITITDWKVNGEDDILSRREPSAGRTILSILDEFKKIGKKISGSSDAGIIFREQSLKDVVMEIWLYDWSFKTYVAVADGTSRRLMVSVGCIDPTRDRMIAEYELPVDVVKSILVANGVSC